MEMDEGIEFRLDRCDASEVGGDDFYGRQLSGADAFRYLGDRSVLWGGHWRSEGKSVIWRRQVGWYRRNLKAGARVAGKAA